MTRWYEQDGTPDAGIYWWAVEHRGHPCCYLRALLPGDFAPGCGPAARHAVTLQGAVSAAARCGTCGEAPATGDLEPIERRTHRRGFLEQYRRALRPSPWPAPTDPRTCWLCSSRQREAVHLRTVGGLEVRVCEGCAAHLDRGGR